MIALVLTLLSAASIADAPKKAHNMAYERDGVLYRVAVGDPDNMALTRYAERLAAKRTVVFGSIVFYRSPDSEWAAVPPPMLEHCTLEVWRKLVHSSGYQGCPPTKQIVKLGARVAFRAVGADCRVSVTVPNGRSSPFRLSAGGEDLEVVEIGLPFPGPPRGSYPVSPSIFLRSRGKPSEALGRQVVARLAEITKAPQFFVSIRSDLMFFTECGFPIRFPFDPHFRLPTEKYLDDNPAVSCGWFASRPIQCGPLSERSLARDHGGPYPFALSEQDAWRSEPLLLHESLHELGLGDTQIQAAFRTFNPSFVVDPKNTSNISAQLLKDCVNGKGNN